MLNRSDALLYESANSLIYRLPPGGEGPPAILKILKADYPPPERIAQFNNEFELTKDLEATGIRKALRSDKVDGRHGLVLEYVEARTLREAFAQEVELPTFLDIAIKIAEALQQIHDAGIVHKDINPGNILVNLETGAVKIIDFGISSRIELHTHHLGNPSRLEGTLAYISPEQTGRMNRVVDYRTDFYSLGVTFYEMLTGRLPFAASDPMDLVHSHIARSAEPVDHVREGLPEVLGSIVSRLMAKDADDRYQSAFGLRADLEECRRQWEQGRRIVAFALGANDVAARFQIPQKLYGRQGQTAELLDAFDRVTRGGMEMVLVRGYSGVGKSALVSEIHKPVTLKRGYFVEGKYDQYKRNIPYSAIGQALGDFCGYLLTESEDALAGWRKRIHRAVGENGQLLVDIVPALELVLGAQPPVAKLPPAETLARFLLVFQRFFAAISREEHPLVIFLDDLQWADSASLDLISALLTDEENRHLLLVGAYRDNEVEPGHPLTVMLDEAGQEGATLSFIDLQPLSLEHLSELLRDATHGDDAHVQGLAELVEAKTGGNAFFAHQFLKALHDQGLFSLDPAERTWTADVARIRQSGMTDNVVELMAGKIRSLPTATQDVLRLASCIGNTFDLDVLRLIRENEEPPTAAALWQLMEEGLVLPLDDNYKLLPVFDPARADSRVALRFLHDRVQQAAYSLIPVEERPATHLRIGRLLLEDTPDLHEAVFDVVAHLNKGRELITSPDERMLLAGLNLRAGQRAKESTANLAARAHATAALSLLTAEDWDRNYRLTFESHLLGAETHYLTGDFARAEELIHECLQRADDALDKADVYYLLMLRQTMSSQYAEAIESARKALELFDFDLPHSDLDARINEEMGWILQHFEAHGLESLYERPDMKAADKLATIKILDNLSAPTYVSGQTQLWILHVLLKVRLSIEHGNSPETAYAFSELGLIFCILGQFKYGYPSGKLSRRLAERFKDASLRHKARSLHLIANYITPWFKPLRDTESINTESYQASLESGELIFAGYTVFHPFYNWFTTGTTPLGELLARIPSSLAFSKKIRHDLAHNSLRGMELLGANLRGDTPDPETFAHGNLDETGFLTACNDDRDFYSIALFHVFKAKVLYLYGALGPALESFRKTVDLAGPLSGHAAALGTRNATHSLILLGLCDDAEPGVRQEHLEEVERNQEQLKAWAESCPQNFAHKHLLVEAEKARVLGQKDEALRLYLEAIHSARENEFVHEEALAHERAARYWQSEGNSIYARAHLLEARYGYHRWGATRKVGQLDAEHPLLLGETRASSLTTTTASSTTTTTGSRAAEALDVVTVVKASQALSGEMILAKLLERMAHIVMESAGAQRAALLLEKDGRWYVEAEGSVDGGEVQVLRSVRLEDSTSLPASILNYAIRTKRELLRDDPVQEGAFARDPYLRRTRPKSVLAMPLVHQGKLGGVLYLENDLTAGAFTPERVELLRLLSSQMAVSIANARLYESVSELSEAYRRFVPHEFLRTLGHESILSVKLGDQIQQEMTVLFSDIRSYTTLSEGMTPEENFNFINAYLKRVGPAIKRNGGFINQYYGDGIMAIFPSCPEDALRGALDVLKKLAAYNVHRERKGRQAIHMGVGLHTGKLMLGVIGDEERHDTGVISDAVNTAARVEGLTKMYGASIVLSEDCFLGIPDVESYGHRFLGRVQVKGRARTLAVYEFFDGDPEEVVALKQQTKDRLAEALDDYFARRFPEAAVSLKKVLEVFPGDKTARRYLENAARHMVDGVDEDWSGVEKMTEK